MADPSAVDGRRQPRVRRRERETGGRRAHRFLVSYNEAELAIVREAADRDNTALASWVGSAGLDVATERVVPVSVDARDVVGELIQARNQVSRVGSDVSQIAKALNADGTVTPLQLEAALNTVEKAIRRVDEATRQVMRERRPRS